MVLHKTEEKGCDSSAKTDKISAVTESENENLTSAPRGYNTDDVVTCERILSTNEKEENKSKIDTDETKADASSRIFLDREQPDVNISSYLQEQRSENEEVLCKIPLGLENEKLSRSNSLESIESVTSGSKRVKKERASDCENMSYSDEKSESVVVDMGDISEDNAVETGGKASPGVTVVYVCEGENLELESDVCRICHCGEEAGVLISPCLCTGSVKFVHHACLMNWLQRAVMSKCELCLFPLDVKRTRKPFKKWRLPEDKPFPILWLFTFVVAMTLNIASITKDGSQRCVTDPCIIFYVLGSAGALLGLAFFYHWLRKTMRYFGKWIALNQEWSLVGSHNLRERIGQTNLACSTKTLSQPDQTQQIA